MTLRGSTSPDITKDSEGSTGYPHPQDSIACRHQNAFHLQPRPWTSMWTYVVAWATDTNTKLAAIGPWTEAWPDITMTLGGRAGYSDQYDPPSSGSLAHEHQYGFRLQYRPLIYSWPLVVEWDTDISTDPAAVRSQTQRSRHNCGPQVAAQVTHNSVVPWAAWSTNMNMDSDHGTSHEHWHVGRRQHSSWTSTQWASTVSGQLTPTWPSAALWDGVII